VTEVVVRTEYRAYALALCRFAGRQHQDWDVIGERLCDTGERIFGPGSMLANEYADAVTARDATEAVGNRKSNPFLPAHDRTYPDLRARFDQIVVWITRDEFDAFPFQNFRNDL
jgi:hypothetical protein